MPDLPDQTDVIAQNERLTADLAAAQARIAEIEPLTPANAALDWFDLNPEKVLHTSAFPREIRRLPLPLSFPESVWPGWE